MAIRKMTAKGKQFAELVYGYVMEGDETKGKEVLTILASEAKGVDGVDCLYDKLGRIESVDSSISIDLKTVLCQMLYHYANYDSLREKAAKKGKGMKESKEFYANGILETFKKLLFNTSIKQAYEIVGKLL